MAVEMHGVIIGARGRKVQEIEAESGAKVAFLLFCLSVYLSLACSFLSTPASSSPTSHPSSFSNGIQNAAYETRRKVQAIEPRSRTFAFLHPKHEVGNTECETLHTKHEARCGRFRLQS